MGGIREEKEVSILDEQLDEFGFQSKPGSTKGRMCSSRFYHKELKMVIKNLMLELIDEMYELGITDLELRQHQQGVEIPVISKTELRQKVEEL